MRNLPRRSGQNRQRFMTVAMATIVMAFQVVGSDLTLELLDHSTVDRGPGHSSSSTDSGAGLSLTHLVNSSCSAAGAVSEDPPQPMRVESVNENRASKVKRFITDILYGIVGRKLVRFRKARPAAESGRPCVEH